MLKVIHWCILGSVIEAPGFFPGPGPPLVPLWASLSTGRGLLRHSVTPLLVRINTVVSINSIHSNRTVDSMCVCPAGCVVAATAMKPRMLLTLDGEGQLLSVPVRLGQAVDVVAQAGRPKTITGTSIGLQSICPA
jgi:hypothetical protein